VAGAGHPAEADALIASLRAADPAAWQRHAAGWEQARRDYAEQGYCVAEGEWHADVHAVAVPMRRRVDGQVFVFNCGVPVRRLRAGELRQRIAPRLLTLVARVEKMLERQDAD